MNPDLLAGMPYERLIALRNTGRITDEELRIACGVHHTKKRLGRDIYSDLSPGSLDRLPLTTLHELEGEGRISAEAKLSAIGRRIRGGK
jgi:hypothetical protein